MPLIRRIPKRGFSNSLFRVEYEAVNVSQLAPFAGETITIELLKTKGLVKKRTERVKILAGGNVEAPLDVHAQAFSKAAREKIEAAGGSATVVDVAKKG